MKTQRLSVRLLVSGALVCLPCLAISAADTNATAPQAAVSQAPTTSVAVQYPYGVEDVVKLSRAQISEDIIVNFVQNSGTIYNLGPKDIVNLKNEGVSDRVLNAMLDQKKTVPQSQVASAGQPAPTVPNAPTVPDANAVAPAPTYTQPAPVYTQPAPVYDQPASPPASTVYVIPYSGYYGPYTYGYPYRYYGPYYGYYGPSITFGFGYGGYGHGHYYYHGHHH